MKVSRPTEAECAALARHHDDTAGVTAENLAETCARFGDEKMALVVTRSNEAGWVRLRRACRGSRVCADSTPCRRGSATARAWSAKAIAVC
jgi:hypothetical protein